MAAIFQGGVDFEAEWANAQVTVRKLLNLEYIPKIEWQRLFNIAQRIAASGDNDVKRLRESLEAEIAAHLLAIASRVHESTDHVSLVSSYMKELKFYERLVKLLPDPFAEPYRREILGRRNLLVITVNPNDGLAPIMRKMWSTHVVKPIEQRLADAAMEFLQKERLGENVDPQLIIAIREAFVNYDQDEKNPLQFYKENFEKPYADACRDFYKDRTAQILHDKGVFEYITYAHTHLTAERERAARYLDTSQPESCRSMTQSLFHIFVVPFHEQLLIAAAQLIGQKNAERLRQLYAILYVTVDDIKPLLACLSSWSGGVNATHTDVGSAVDGDSLQIEK